MGLRRSDRVKKFNQPIQADGRYCRIQGDPSKAVANKLRRLLLDRYGYECWTCGARLHNLPIKESTAGRRKATLEHVTPVREGGLTTLANLEIACFSCNCSKG